MDKIDDYAKLYSLQDQILNIVSELNTGFYLTGGTCLHRFYIEKRYSDDLDFFTSDTKLFREYVRLVTNQLKSKLLKFEILVDSRDFVRIRLSNLLKMDLVSDFVFRHGSSSLSPQNYLIDNLTNITANKLCAIIGRDDPKDVFDLATIRSLSPVDWKLIIDVAAQKSNLELDYLKFRLQTFPTSLFDHLHLVDPSWKNSAIELLKVIVNEIDHVAS